MSLVFANPFEQFIKTFQKANSHKNNYYDANTMLYQIFNGIFLHEILSGSTTGLPGKM